MRGPRSTFLILSVLLALEGCADSSQQASARRQLERFTSLVDDYFDGYYQFRPHESTAIGFHQYDDRLGSFNVQDFQKETARVEGLLGRMKQIDVAQLDSARQTDARILDNEMKEALFRLREMRPWEREPTYYNDIVNNGISSLITRDFEDKEIRLQKVMARERQISNVLENARQNLKNPPRLLTEIAISQIEGSIEYFRDEVVREFARILNKALLEEFRQTNDGVIRALEGHLKFLRDDLLPRSAGEVAIGEASFVKLLELSEGIQMKPAQLREMGRQEMDNLQAQFVETARRVDPRKSPALVLKDLNRDHPGLEELVQAVEQQVEDIRRFSIDKNIITIPSEVRPLVALSPGFSRALSSIGAMNTPGTYEPRATAAYFNLAPPPPPGRPTDMDEYLGFFNRSTLPIVTMLETYPGRYLHYLWLKSNPSKVRRIVRTRMTGDGWAHYSEEMLLDEGFRNSDPRIRLAQLQLARLRAVRFLTSLDMHTTGLSVEDAEKMFRTDAEQSPINAAREARRSANDPLALSWTFGRLEILGLREEYRRKKGNAFSLREFHDEFLRQGVIPLPMIKAVLLSEVPATGR